MWKSLDGGKGTMKRNLIVTVLLLLCAVSCNTSVFDTQNTIGDTVIEIQFDLLDYLDDSQRVLAYGDDPEIPGDGGVIEVDSPAKVVNIGDELGSVKTIESVNIFLDYELDNSSGWADLEYIVYLSEVGEDPFSVPGIHSESVELRPGLLGKGGLTISADDRLRDLFTQKQFQYAAKLKVTTQAGSENIEGVAAIVSFVADVIFTI